MALFNVQNRWAFPIGQPAQNFPLVAVNNFAVASRFIGAVGTAVLSGFVPNSGGGVSTRGSKRSSDDPPRSGETRSGKRYRLPAPSTSTPTQEPVHRRFEPEIATISQNTTKMASSSAAEVPVMPHGRVSKIQPDYFTVDLPYYADFAWPTSHTASASTNHYSIRLNSIYDPIVGALVNTQPQGRDNWALNFDFYRVLQTNIKVIFINQDYQDQVGVASGANPLGAYYACGWEFIEQGGTVSDDFKTFLTTKHAEREILPAATTGRYWNGTAEVRYVEQPSHVQMTHTYSPHRWDYHVQESGLEETWTPMSQNPANSHYMALRVMNMGSSNQPADGFIRSIVQITYKVQFREAKASLIKTLDTTAATYGGAGEDPTDT
jgi:hypothetical protein